MKVLRDESGRKNREYWEFVEKTSREVASWPAWKTGQSSVAPKGKGSEGLTPPAKDKKR
jgi:hypothetical protein